MHPFLQFYEEWAFFQDLIKEKKNFEWHIRGLKNYIIIDKNKFENIYHFKKINYSLLSKVKKDARIYMEKNQLKNEVLRARFFKSISEKPDYKIDIKAAYWNAAKDIFLSEETYNLGINDKESRLVALGSLATKEIIRTYELGILKEEVVVLNKFAPIYFKVCNYIDDVCNTLSKYSLGYWVDCFFVKENQKEFVCEQLENFGFNYSIEKVNHFEIKNNIMVLNSKPYPLA